MTFDGLPFAFVASEGKRISLDSMQTRGEALSSLYPFSLNLDGGALATHVILQEPTMLNRTQSIPYRVFEARQLLSIQQTARLGQTNFWKDLLKESKQDYILIICWIIQCVERRGKKDNDFTVQVRGEMNSTSSVSPSFHTQSSQDWGRPHLMSKPDNTRDSVPFTGRTMQRRSPVFTMTHPRLPIIVRSWKPCNPNLGNSVPGAVFIFSLIPRNGYITRILLEHARPLI
ncbi:hypothetical protein EDD18DRAFT_1339877 [Armillaria luteobubalina]|uniref:Uncharacterized protein n=1 Tax=Armillaria luteobubalina TaxID=153913 RepID=A0AA39NX51_9AGAR|nr:hypothetical protein EDD18DRAFT_1339877 [Armillaria luteobubalina]